MRSCMYTSVPRCQVCTRIKVACSFWTTKNDLVWICETSVPDDQHVQHKGSENIIDATYKPSSTAFSQNNLSTNKHYKRNVRAVCMSL